jgi:hypothetical protein
LGFEGDAMSRDLNWADLLDRDLGYVVLRKRNRLQVILRPTDRQLRRRGKRGWSVAAVGEMAEGGNGQAEPPPTDALREATLEALLALAADVSAPRQGKGKKGKKKKAGSANPEP